LLGRQTPLAQTLGRLGEPAWSVGGVEQRLAAGKIGETFSAERDHYKVLPRRFRVRVALADNDAIESSVDEEGEPAKAGSATE
jgi:hypothetical protein